MMRLAEFAPGAKLIYPWNAQKRDKT